MIKHYRLASLLLALGLALGVFSAQRVLSTSESGSASTWQQCLAPPANLVNWWSGDGHASDIQGSQHGTLQNGAGFAPGKVGQAFSLNGVDQYVNVGDVDLSATFTIEAWINPTSFPNPFPYILNKDDGFSDQRSYFLALNQGKLRQVVRNTNGEFTQYETDLPVVVAGSLQHIVVTYDGNAPAGQKIKFYLNGVNLPAGVVSCCPEQDAGGVPENNSLPARIGIGGDGVDRPFAGLIDELSIYQRVLSAAEIQQIYAADSAGKCKPGIDLAISKSHTGDFTPGMHGASYTIRVSNVGTAANTSPITVTDTLPPPSDLTFQSATGMGWSCTNTPPSQIVTCVYGGTLAPGALTEITLTVNVGTLPAVNEFYNVVQVATTGDANAANNEAQDLTRIIGLPDMAITKSHTGNFVVGSNGVYTINVRNIGSGPTSGLVRMVDTLPNGLSYVATAAPPGWTCNLEVGSTSVVECRTTNGISPNQSFTFSLTVAVAAAAAPGVVNRANVSAANESQSGNNQAEDPTVVTGASGNTPPGSNVTVQPIDSTTGTQPVTLTFAQVNQPGNTTLTVSNGGPAPPSAFRLGNPPTWYELNTTASFAGQIGVCINYTGVSFFDEAALRFFHFEGGAWVDITTSLNTQTNVICGSTNSLSPFAIFERVYQFSGFFSPVANPPTVNVVNAGSAVPVKFSLGGNQGLDIVAAGYPQSQAINCDTSSPQSDLAATVTAGSSSLSYDASTDRYTYVWKTDKAWAGSCRLLIVKLKDGTQHVAYFRFK